jgi:hypothetical protein
VVSVGAINKINVRTCIDYAKLSLSYHFLSERREVNNNKYMKHKEKNIGQEEGIDCMEIYFKYLLSLDKVLSCGIQYCNEEYNAWANYSNKSHGSCRTYGETPKQAIEKLIKMLKP